MPGSGVGSRTAVISTSGEPSAESEGGAPEPEATERPRVRCTKPENTDLSFSLRSCGERNGRSTGRRHRQLSLVPVGREVSPADGLTQKDAAGEKNHEFER